MDEKEFCTVLEITEILLQNDSANPTYIQLKAEALFQSKLYAASIQTYEQLKDYPEYNLIANIGIGKAYLKTYQCYDAMQAFERAIVLYPDDIQAQYYFAGNGVNDPNFINETILKTVDANKLEAWAHAYLQNGMSYKALLFFRAAVERDPAYFPAWTGLAETLSTHYRYNEALEIYRALLANFPDNSKITIAIARVLGWSKHYRQSIDCYDRMIMMKPDDPVLFKEKARTAIWGNLICTSMSTYQKILDPIVDERTNYLSLYLVQRSAEAEMRAKKLVWDKRYLKALCAYKSLLNLNPGNEDALYEYAQTYCNLGLCNCANIVYKELLHIDPNHNLAQISLRINRLNTHLCLKNYLSYWREVGSGTFSQSQIARYRLDTVLEMPLSCTSHLRFIQTEYVENPFYNFKFYPAEGQTLEADYVFNANFRALFSITYKDYFNKFDSQITCRNNIGIRVNDYLQIGLGLDKENEIYNFFSLKQGIQSITSWILAKSDITHNWYLEGSFQNLRYNDHNNQIHFNLATKYVFIDSPRCLQLILQGNYRNTNHQSISIIVDNKLVDVIHPYWTPDKYFSGSIALDYQHDYRRIASCESPQRYFGIRITGETDNVDNPSIQVILTWKHEFERFGFELKGLIHRSRQWNAEGGWASLYYRF